VKELLWFRASTGIFYGGCTLCGDDFFCSRFEPVDATMELPSGQGRTPSIDSAMVFFKVLIFFSSSDDQTILNVLHASECC
jgi:hypothetical protein